MPSHLSYLLELRDAETDAVLDELRFLARTEVIAINFAAGEVARLLWDRWVLLHPLSGRVVGFSEGDVDEQGDGFTFIQGDN